MVENLKRRKITSVVGSKKDDSPIAGVETKKRDTWDFYVGNLIESVGESEIEGYLKDNGVDRKLCYILSSRIKGTRSARVRIMMKDKDTVLTPSFWPEHVRVRSWVIKPGWASQRGYDSHQDIKGNG